MSRIDLLNSALAETFGDKLVSIKTELGEVTAVVRPQDQLSVTTALRDTSTLRSTYTCFGPKLFATCSK